ncbi:cache domain-containing sensor histidine kinase [Paenibacillus gorillae]|uniref:cache domain-containing sensor histidine kinase n=1 Tax=Paenibacillus gorillae TaxID=1243662 RepID=UPI0004BA3A47|nr:sensor histidine kinase [Paenibacillus gorillae]
MRWISSSLKRKLSFLLLLSVLIPLLALGLFSYDMAATATEQKAKQSGLSILSQTATNLEFIVQDIENISIFIIGQKDIQQYLSNRGDDAVKQTQMIEFLSNLVFSKSYISDITIYPMYQSHLLSNTTIFKTELPALSGQDGQSFQASEKWWSARYETTTAAGTKQVISLVRPIRSINSFKQIGTLVISVDEKALSKILDQAGMPGGGSVVLSNAEGKLLSGSVQEEMPLTMKELLPGYAAKGNAGAANYGSGDGKRTVLHDTVAGVNWRLTGIMPFSEYRSQNNYVLKIMAIVIVLSVIIVTALVLYFVQRITNPLSMLTQFLKSSSPEEPMRTYPVETMDEVGQLVRSYNKLSERIVALTEQVKLEESYKKEADMQALQAQINPHFLYNTLSSIHWMALMNQDAKTADMVGSLSDFLRFSLNKGEEFCTVEQEAAHAGHYATIQAIRFPDRFKLTMRIDPELQERVMLKLLLQPLIENALIHGVQKREGFGEITVTAQRQGNWMAFAVSDNGAGMDALKLAAIEKELHGPDDRVRERERLQEGSYGLRNVHKRLLLHYGTEAGLRVESTEGIGTRVSFAIPISQEEEAV